MPDDTFQHAFALYRQGKPAEAESACLEVLRPRPNHYGALHLLGIIAFQTGRAERAVELIGQAITLNPRSAEAYNNRGTALRNLGRSHEALLDYEQAITLRPDHPEAHYNRGAVLRNSGRLEEAVSAYNQAIALKPDFADAYFNRGNALLDLGQSDAALADYDRAIMLKPDHAEAHNNRGKTLRDLGRFEESLAGYDKLMALNPDFAESHNNRANVLRDLGRPQEAVVSCERAIALNPEFAEAYVNRGTALGDLGRAEDAMFSHDKAIALRPDFAEAHNNRGNALTDLGRTDEALASYHRAITLKPDYPDAFNNLGNALASLALYEDALSSYDRVIASRPDHADAHNNRANVLRSLGRHEDALSGYIRAITLKPDFAGAHWNQSLCQLAMGDYETGWTNYEWRWKSELARAWRNLPGCAWLGDSPIENKTILVQAEQGLGDSLQFCRYIPVLAALANVVLEVPRPLVRLLTSLKGAGQVIASGDPPPRFDAWTPMLSLPLAFRTTLSTIPAAGPYLYADPERSAAWRHRLATLPGRKIGLVWAGSPRPENPKANATDRRRSITLDHYAPLAAIPGVGLISLQKGDAAAWARTPPAGMELHDWTEELEDFADTAALIEALDLVISVDTSVAHLAGALGKPVWVLNRYDQCWRWLRGRNDSPWYPTARLFQQRTPGDWAGVMREVTDALRDWR